MKTFKTTQLAILLFLGFAYSCNNQSDKKDQSQHPDVPSLIIADKCPGDSTALFRVKYDEIIVKLEPCAKKQWPHLIKKAFKKFKDDLNLSVLKACECDSTVVLFKVNGENPNPEDRLASANENLKAEGNNLGNASYNIDFSYDVVDPPDYRKIQTESKKKESIENKMIVAVIDGGIQWKNDPDYNGYMWKNESNCGELNGKNFTDDTTVGMNHGSVVGKFIVQEIDSNDIKIMDLRIFNNQGETDLYKASCAISFAIEHGANIINASWGYYLDDYNISFFDIIKSTSYKNMIFVTSAGNKGLNTDKCTHFPSCFDEKKYHKEADNVISVAYLDLDENKLHKESNFGKKTVSLAAKGTFESFDGSSYAAAHVTRAVAIIKGNNGLQPPRKTIECLLKNNTVKIPGMPVSSEGKLKEPLDYSNCTSLSGS